jgi:RimJ/RimL family protein N-acetyltransferase
VNIDLVPYDTRNAAAAAELAAIFARYYPTSPWLPSAEKIMQGRTRYYRALHDGVQIGVTGYVAKTPTLAETVKTTVFDEFRGRGLGQGLSQAIEDECRRNGIRKVMTTIFSTNHAMIAIKLRQGYTIEGYHPDHEAPGFHEYSLGKIFP